ncbi:MAG: glycosyltransferase family 1 protein [Gemmatimonadota bacterium]|nr:glycosyltransferase family 1 protein [Gemmatimonadota bacterium]
MKIAITVEALKDGHFAGVQQYIHNLIHRLADSRDLDLTLIASPQSPRSLFPDNAGMIYHSPAEVLGSGLLSAVFAPPRCLSGFDLIHCPTVTAPFFFRPGAKVVMTVHDLVPLLFPEWQTRRRVLYFKHILKHRFRFVDRFIAVSHSTGRDLVRHFRIPEHRIDVIHEGVSEQFEPGAASGEAFILAVSTLEPRKNFKRIIEAFVNLRKTEKTRDRLVIVGKEGWLFDEIVRVPPAFQDDVVFTGYVSELELIRLFQAARCFVYPSMYEGFGLPVLEAMACGCPVITSNTSSMPEVAGDAALLVDPYEVADIEDAICRLTDEPALCAELSAKGIQRASEFSWRRTARQTLDVYRKTVTADDV